MGILKKLLELYKESLKPEEEKEETIELAEGKESVELPPLNYGEKPHFEKPDEGVVFELVPPPDGLEMLFLILEVKKDLTTVVPLSGWWEFATPRDVVIQIEGKPYIVQTDLAIDIPTQGFSQWFEESLYEIAKLPDETLSRIKAVYEGREKGDGTLVFPEKEEFKKLEACRYAPLWYRMVELSEELGELNEALKQLKKSLKEEALPKAAEVQPVHGSGEGIEFLYNEEERILYLYPLEEYVGKMGRITISLGRRTFLLYEGILRREIRIPLSPESYDYEIFREGLRIEPF